MRCKAFIDRAAAWAGAHGEEWRVDSGKGKGKGSHKSLFIGDRRTTVQTAPGTFHGMLRHLGIPKQEF